jgi:hypothetical protein
MSICRRMMVTAVRLVVIILRVLQLGVVEGDFSIFFPNVSICNVSGLVIPYETRKCQRINYKLLNEFGHRSVGLDEHMNNKVSSETGVISHVKNSPIFDNAMRMPGKNSGIFKTSANFYENMKILDN